MGKEKLAHMSQLQHPVSGSINTMFLRDSKHHLSVGEPMESEEALKVAREYKKELAPLKVKVFIEGEDAPATTNLNCDFCDDRKSRDDFYSAYIPKDKKK